MKISIVTICFKEEKNIAKTIESVLMQSSEDFEYIICDAKSPDKTVEIAESYKEQFEEKGVAYFVNSEKDAGIYDGMNKGIAKASGEYIYFLNAGDSFFDKDVVGTVIKAVYKNEFPDILYGAVATVEKNITTILPADHTRLEEYMSVSHPGVFAKTELMKESPFSIDYKIGADYHFILGQFLQKKNFFKVENLVVAYFSSDGVSSVNIIQSIKEQEKVKSEYGVKTRRLKWLLFAYKKQLFVVIKRCIPQKVWELWSVKIKKKSIC